MPEPRPRRIPLLAATAAIAVVLALLAGGCGSDPAAVKGLTIHGPGLQVGRPPWHPEYAHLAQRLRIIGIPLGGSEKFHIHAMLHVYVDGLLVPVPPDVGIDLAHKLEASLHTHDSTGIIHMEAPRPFAFTLGDFFAVWGVKLGPDRVGGLTGLGGNHLHFLLNGLPLANPAAHVLRNGDSIVIGYGPPGSFPHAPSTFLLKEVEEGKGGLGCSASHGNSHAHSCLTLTTPPAKGSSPAKG